MLLMLIVSMLLSIAIYFPGLALTLLVVVCGILLIGAVIAAFFAVTFVEGMFCHWLDNYSDQENGNGDKENTRMNESGEDNETETQRGRKTQRGRSS